MELRPFTARADLPHKLAVVTINDVLSGHAVGVGSDRDRRAVHVGAADHQHLVANHALMAGEDISRQIGAGKMTEMA